MFACVLSMSAMAQATRTIKGAVIDRTGNPLPGATVEAKGGAESTTTDADGTFSMEVPIWLKSATAKYSGYKDQTKKVGMGDLLFEMSPGKNGRVYNRFTLAYTPQFIYGQDTEGIDGKTMQGAAFKWNIGIKLSHSINLYLETGVDINIFNWKYEYVALYQRYNYVPGGKSYYTPELRHRDEDKVFGAITVPVNVVYRLRLSDKIYFQPYVGLHVKINAGDGVHIPYENYKEENNVCQVGMQFGVGFTFKKFYLGAGFAPDFNSYVKNFKMSSGVLDLSLGIQF